MSKTTEKKELASYPSYADLRSRTDGPPGSSWGVFGPQDQVGAANFLTPDRVLDGVKCVRKGSTFNLDYPINHFEPPPARFRKSAKHTVLQFKKYSRDDVLDGLFLQITSHIDGLRHKQHNSHGFYNYTAAERVVPGDPTIGVNRWAERGGLVGRAVLLDVAGYRLRKGNPLDHRASEPIGPDLLESVAADQGVEVRPGDMLLIRTDWPRHFFATVRSDFETARFGAGLDQSYEMLAWLWDHRIPLAAADNLALEAIPERIDSPFGERDSESGVDGKIHPQLISLLGLVVGELWKLDELAADCASDGVYEALLVVKPLNLTGGVASPANAVAIK